MHAYAGPFQPLVLHCSVWWGSRELQSSRSDRHQQHFCKSSLIRLLPNTRAIWTRTTKTAHKVFFTCNQHNVDVTAGSVSRTTIRSRNHSPRCALSASKVGYVGDGGANSNCPTSSRVSRYRVLVRLGTRQHIVQRSTSNLQARTLLVHTPARIAHGDRKLNA